MEQADHVFSLYKKYGNNDYLGEPVSQLEHAIQCAMVAEKEGYSDEVGSLQTFAVLYPLGWCSSYSLGLLQVESKSSNCFCRIRDENMKILQKIILKRVVVYRGINSE